MIPFMTSFADLVGARWRSIHFVARSWTITAAASPLLDGFSILPRTTWSAATRSPKCAGVAPPNYRRVIRCRSPPPPTMRRVLRLGPLAHWSSRYLREVDQVVIRRDVHFVPRRRKGGVPCVTMEGLAPARWRGSPHARWRGSPAALGGGLSAAVSSPWGGIKSHWPFQFFHALPLVLRHCSFADDVDA